MDLSTSRFWLRTVPACLLVGVCALAIAALSARGFDDIATLYATLYLCWCIIALASGAALCLRWKLTGEAPVGLLAAALIAMAVPQLPLALIDVAADPLITWRRLGPTTRLVSMLPAIWLLVRCLRAPEVDSGLRPLRLTVGYTTVGAACPATLVLLERLGLHQPSPALAPSAAGYLIAVLTVGLAWGFSRHARSIDRPLSRGIVVVFACLTVAATVEIVARRWAPSMLVAAGAAAVVALALLMLVAWSLLRGCLDSAGVRLRSLSAHAAAAGVEVQREQERMHELRATVAGIRQASVTLRRYGDQIEPARQQDVREMMADEIERLERLLDHRPGDAGPRPVLLDEVLRPLVVSHREQGTAVHWQPSDARALVQGDQIAEVLNILLTNARAHAPGSPVDIDVSEHVGLVRLVVRDRGPGVSAEVAHRLFERGAHRNGSPGQGLGLHIAQRLAADSGGALTLLPASEGAGAQFALTLPAATSGEEHVRLPCPAEDAG